MWKHVINDINFHQTLIVHHHCKLSLSLLSMKHRLRFDDTLVLSSPVHLIAWCPRAHCVAVWIIHLLATKLRIYTTCVLAVGLHGAETWTLLKEDSRRLDPSAAAASRRAEFLDMRRAAAEFFLWISRIPAEFFKRSSQPNIFRRKFVANIQRSLNETDYIKSSHFS